MCNCLSPLPWQAWWPSIPTGLGYRCKPKGHNAVTHTCTHPQNAPNVDINSCACIQKRQQLIQEARDAQSKPDKTKRHHEEQHNKICLPTPSLTASLRCLPKAQQLIQGCRFHCCQLSTLVSWLQQHTKHARNTTLHLPKPCGCCDRDTTEAPSSSARCL